MKFKVALIALTVFAGCFPALAETRISTSAAMSAAVVKPAPEYSSVAKQMNVWGRVELEVTINADGEVETVRAISGNALLTRSAIDAVKRWKFTPFTENGVTVPAVAILAFDFKK